MIYVILTITAALFFAVVVLSFVLYKRVKDNEWCRHQNNIFAKQAENHRYNREFSDQKIRDLKAHNFQQSQELTTLRMEKSLTFGLNEYQDRALVSAVYPDSYAVTYPALALAGEAGEVANKVKKLLRGDYVLDDDRRDAIGKEIGGVLWYCAALARDLNLTLSDIARQNIRVLEDRQERGVIQGDGDNR